MHGITNVLHVRLVRDSATGQGRGYGFAAFGNDTGVQKALRLAGTDFGEIVENNGIAKTRTTKHHDPLQCWAK